ncbi:MAG TPA: 2-nitropropane dioxygenase, partial [Planctomycetia bacterium]|nr:2-nitropropane dioxygenase [Planctomycetia bacterium]
MPATRTQSSPAETERASSGTQDDQLREYVEDLARPVFVRGEGTQARLSDEGPAGGFDAYCPPLPLQALGDRSFAADLGIEFPYASGAMANGIGSVEIVETLGRAGMLGFFGAAGLSHERVAGAIDALQSRLGGKPFGVNLIHSPNEPAHEMGTAELLLRRGVRLIEASAYLDLTPAVIRYRATGLARGAD